MQCRCSIAEMDNSKGSAAEKTCLKLEEFHELCTARDWHSCFKTKYLAKVVLSLTAIPTYVSIWL